MVNSISVVAAYQRALKANERIKSSIDAHTQKLQPTAILRAGDDLTILNLGESKIQAINAPRTDNSFSSVLERELVTNPINSINSAGATMFELAKTDGSDLGPNLVELVAAVDKASLTVATMVSVREKIVDAYKTIFNMQI